jgi:quercetin dioxygenase-like cupin family protein
MRRCIAVDEDHQHALLLHDFSFFGSNVNQGIMMAIQHAEPGDIIDVKPLGDALAHSTTRALIKTKRFEVLRMVLPAGKSIGEHQAKGEIIVHCIEGHIIFTTLGKNQALQAGQMLYLPAGEPHSLQAIEPSSVLLTLMF